MVDRIEPDAVTDYWESDWQRHQPSGVVHRQLRSLGTSAGNQDGVLSEVA